MPFTVQGLEKIQAARLKLIQEMQPDGALGKAVVYGTLAMQKGLVSRIHRDTGTYAAAQITNVHGLVGRIYTGAYRNSRSGAAASTYGPIEESRGGSHAAYANTYREDGQSALGEMQRIVESSLP
jgi:hypothetical protein